MVTEELIKKVQAGDTAAFTELYKYYYKRIYSYVYQRCSNREVAEDVVQNTFIKVFKSIHELRSVYAFRSWIFKIAYHELADTLGLETKEKHIIYEEENMQYIDFDNTFSIHKKFNNIQIIDVVHAAIENISPKLQDVAILYYYEQMPLKEITDILNIPIGTVKSRLNQVNIKIRAALLEKEITPTICTSSSIPIWLVSGLLNTITIPKGLANIEVIGLLGQVNKKTFRWIKMKHPKQLLALPILTIGFFILFPKTPTTTSVTIPIYDITIQEKEEPCLFSTITYPTNFTASPITVLIETTNSNYDQILINSIDTRIINQNGRYHITLWKDSTLLDERTVVISNIDTECPTYNVVKLSSHQYRIDFNDDISGINPDSITYYYNGLPSDDFQYYQNSVYFTKDENCQNITITIKDYANNMSSVSLQVNIK